MSALPVHGSKPNAASARIIHEHSGGEDPWLVLGGTAGVLAAFSNQLVIVKAGAMTGLMAGTLGGHRVTSFSYTEHRHRVQRRDYVPSIGSISDS